MTKQEQQQLSTIVDRLAEVQEQAPQTVTYGRGQSTASISYQLLNILHDFKEVIGYEPTEPDAEPEQPATA